MQNINSDWKTDLALSTTIKILQQYKRLPCTATTNTLGEAKQRHTILRAELSVPPPR
jgi:hypothetical protein